MQLLFFTNGGILSISRGFQISLSFTTVATVSFTCPFGRYFLWKEAELRRNPILLLSIVRDEGSAGCESVLGWWVVGWLIGHRVSIISVISDIRAAGKMSLKLYGFKEIVEVCCLSKEQLCWSMLEMNLSFSTRPGNLIPFLIDLFDFCRSFRIESNTTIKIYIGHDVLLIEEVHNVKKTISWKYDYCLVWYQLLGAKKKELQAL